MENESTNITPISRTASITNENSTIITYTFIGNPNLINNTAYKFTVTANNINGSSAPSNESNTIVPVTIPNTISGDTDFINGEPYTFNVTANNIIGSSARSNDSNSIILSTIPDAPTTITCVSENSQVIVSWIAPTNNGGSAITSYTVTNNAGVDPVTTINGSTTTATVSGLTNGTSYTFTVFATNINGDSLPSIASSEIIPSTVPNVPTSVSGTSGNTQATISWTAPVATGGSAITSYTVTSNPGGLTKTTTDGSTTTATVEGLTNGTSYTFTVVATNIKGSSSASTASSEIIPSTVPNVPTSVSGTSGNTQATISWTAPVATGGSAITSYTVTSNPGGLTKTTLNGSTTTATVEGLTNGTSYTFTVVATNIKGSSSASTASSEIIPSTVPDEPTNVLGTPGNTEATLYWTAPISNGGSAITSYTVTSNPGGLTATSTSSSTTIRGLTNGIPYTFTVVATNIKGDSDDSIASSEITPATTPDAPTTITCTTGNLYIDLSWNIPNNGGSEITYYNIQYSSNNGINWTDVSSNTNYKSITGLTNGTSYIFRIATRNIVGTSSYSSNTSAHTPFNIVETPYITNSEIGNNSASIFFTQSNTSGYPITKYKYTLDNGVSFIEKNINQSPIFISNINNGTQYTVKISAYTQIGWSNLSNEISITPVDNRTTEIKTAIANLTSTTITDLKNQVFTELSSTTTSNKIQIINNVALDISNQPQDLRISTLLNMSLNIDYSSNSIKSNLNTLMIDAGILKNVPYIISDPVLVNQIISGVSYKNINWLPTSLAIIIPNDNNTLTIDFNNIDFVLLLTPGVTYNINGKYLGNTSYNSFNVNYNRTDISRYLTVNNSINKQLGDTIIYNFPGMQLNFKINMLGSIGGNRILVPAGAGDPHILTVNGDSYMLPHDENCYLLYDNNIENDRVIVTAKCWFLPKNIIDNSTFRNDFMDNTTFFKYININYNGENLTFDMETLNPVKYTNMRNLKSNKLQFISNETGINMTELFEDKFIFQNMYSKIKLKKYKINFDGKSRIIELENGYKFKLSFDLNCADHRNEIKILEANFNDSCGALINEDVKNSIKYFIPPKNILNNNTMKVEEKPSL